MFDFGVLAQHKFQFFGKAMDHQKLVRVLLGRAYTAAATRMPLCVMAKVVFQIPEDEVRDALASTVGMVQTCTVKIAPCDRAFRATLKATLAISQYKYGVFV